jgi:hypothetical protein
VAQARKGRIYIGEGEEPPGGEHVEEGPRGGHYYEADPEAGREKDWGVHGIRGTFNRVLKDWGVSQEQAEAAALVWFWEWDKDGGTLLVDRLLGRRAAKEHLASRKPDAPSDDADSYIDGIAGANPKVDHALNPVVLKALRLASSKALQQTGLKSVKLHRGVSGKMHEDLVAGKEYRPRPLESWTLSMKVAEDWAGAEGYGDGSVVSRKLPVDQVFLLSDALPELEGMGQHEVVVMSRGGDVIRLAEGDVTPSEAIKPITPEEGTSEEGQETGYEGSEGGAETPHVGRATGSGSIPESKKIEKHLPGKHDQKKHGRARGHAAAGRVGAVDWLDPSEARDLYREILERVTRGDIPEFSNLGDGLLETIRDRLHTALAAMIRRAKKEGGYENFNAAVRIRDALFSVDGVLSQRAKDRSFSAKLEEQVGILTAGNSIDVRDDDARADLKQEIMERTAKGMERKLGVTPEQESENLDKLSYEAARFLNDYYEKVGSPVRISREGDNYRFRGGNRDELTGVRQTLTMALAEGWADAEDKMAKAAPFWAAARTLAPHFRDVYDPAKGVELSSSEKVAYYLTKTWAISSSDHRAPSVALQRVASEAFGVEDTTVAYVEHGSDEIDRIVSKHGPVLRAWVDSVYEDTQALLKELEMDEVVLVRGMGWDEAAKIPDWVSALPADEPTRTRAKLNPLSSFASEYSVATRFAIHHEEEQMLVAARVPRDKIFSTFRTGPGCAEEYEMLVIGGEIDVVARRAGGQELPAWEERFEQDMRHHNIELAAQEAVWLDEDMHNADWTKQTHDVFALQPASGVEKHLPGKHDQKKHGKHGGAHVRRSALIRHIRDINRHGGEAIPKKIHELFTALKIAEQHDFADVYVQDQPIVAEVLVLMPAPHGVPNAVWHTYSRDDMRRAMEDLAEAGELSPDDVGKAAGMTYVGYDEAEVSVLTLDAQSWGSAMGGELPSGPYDTMRAVIAHEYAHVMDDGTERRFSNSDTWLDAFHAAQETARGLPSHYGRDSSAEMFAECVAYMTISPTKFKRRFSGLYDAIAELLEWNPVEDEADTLNKDFGEELGIAPRKFVTTSDGRHIQIFVGGEVEKGAPTEPMDSRAHTGNAPEVTTGIVTTNQGVAGSQDVQDSRNAPITLAEIAHAEMLMRLAAMGINKARTAVDSDLPSRVYFKLDKRGKRRWPSPLERVNMEIGRTKKAMETATCALWRGEGDVDTWHAQMRAAVDDLYGKSAYASTLRLKETPDARQRARDNLMAELRHQHHYLDGFRDDLAAGKVKTEKQAIWRAKLYADGSAGLYHQTVSENLPQMKAHWKLTLGAEHCATCLEMATQSPWPANRMPRLPRDGSTICRSNCRCFLIYRKARPTFRPVRRKNPKKSPE